MSSSVPAPDASYAYTDGFELMYVGIAPKRPSTNGKESGSRLRSRLTAHSKKDASRSTLRLTLGALLASELDLSLGIHKGRLNWGEDGEDRLTRWINTTLAWHGPRTRHPGLSRTNCSRMHRWPSTSTGGPMRFHRS
jgi:hypothetical protein